jgi:hypothetical protein
LDDLWGVGTGGRSGAAVLVGCGGDDTVVGVLLVAGLSERVVWVGKEKSNAQTQRAQRKKELKKKNKWKKS